MSTKAGQQDPAPPLISPADAVQTMEWIHEQVRNNRPLPVPEGELLVDVLLMNPDIGYAPGSVPELIFSGNQTASHSLEVALLAMAFADGSDFSPEDVRRLGLAGLFHNVGMAFVPPDILEKPGVLDAAELDRMKRHPLDGARVLLNSDTHLGLAAVVAYEHHMTHDGGGYPPRRQERQPHQASRIIQVCDIYVAMRTDRPNRPAWSHDQVRSQLAERAGLDIDPDVTNKFLQLFPASGQ